MLENRAKVLERGLREAILLAGNEGIVVKHSPACKVVSPIADDVVNGSYGVRHNITLALEELEAMKAEREKSLDAGHSPKNGRGDQGDDTPRSESFELTDTTSPIDKVYIGTTQYIYSHASFVGCDMDALNPLSVISAVGANGTPPSWPQSDDDAPDGELSRIWAEDGTNVPPSTLIESHVFNKVSNDPFGEFGGGSDDLPEIDDVSKWERHDSHAWENVLYIF